MDKRRLTEETYILGPKQTGKLFDEGIVRLRNKERFKWILDRLNDLGFHHNVDGKKHTLIMEYGGYILYADPREKGSIQIFVYKNKTGQGIKEKNSRKNEKYPIGNFKIQDSWIKDLKMKLRSRIEKVIHGK